MSRIDVLDESLIDLLACPRCKGSLEVQGDSLLCSDAVCRAVFPIVNGVPILINDERSLFSIADFQAGRQTTLNVDRGNLRQRFGRMLPGMGKNWKAEQNYGHLLQLLSGHSPTPIVLVIGGGTGGVGFHYRMLRELSVTLIETDVSFGPRTRIICDGHDIPFEDASVDALIAQAVLEHVVDPRRVVEEIHRVLSDGGFVYAETPFMHPVHLSPYDFTRFTCLGHRRLFRAFEGVESGAVSGPGMSLGLALQYCFLSFATGERSRRIVRVCTSLCLFCLKYLDHFLLNTPRALDAAAGYYFLGRKSNRILSDRELIQQWRGSR